MVLWLIIKDALDNGFGGNFVSAENYWNNLISSPNWQVEAFQLLKNLKG